MTRLRNAVLSSPFRTLCGQELTSPLSAGGILMVGKVLSSSCEASSQKTAIRLKSNYRFINRFGGVDFDESVRRKNATRESTTTLKTWLRDHKKNPYPTKGEKVMLAIVTKMTLTQVGLSRKCHS